jgi:hypothetical protein
MEGRDEMDPFADQERTCFDCGQPYIWHEADQRYAHQMGFRAPKFCDRCRAERKRRRREAIRTEAIRTT